jgi:hypothetical protein
MLRDWFVGSLQVLQSASQPEKWHNLPAMDMQYTPKSPNFFESYELSNKFSTNLDMYLFLIEICGNNLSRRVFLDD